MYNARFLSDSGRKFRFGYEYGNIFDIDPLSGISADISTSQGFQQTGETVENTSTGGIERQIVGKLIRKINEQKYDMLKTFAPGMFGTLYFNERYTCRCVVKQSPQFGEGKNKETFVLTLFCPNSYWLSAEGKSYILGGYSPAFRFPVNYATPHRFGTKNPTAFINCVNDGAVSVDFTARFTADAPVENYGIMNAVTFEYIKIFDNLDIGDETVVYRKNGRLIVEKNGEDIFSLLDEDSNLFSVNAGDNPLKATADSGDENLIVSVSFFEPYSGVYDGM